MSSDLEKWRSVGRLFEEILRPHTYPLAIKLVKDESEFPEKTRRPEKKIAVCQALTISRRYGWTMGVTGDDSGCPAASLNYGWSSFDDTLIKQFLLGVGYVSSDEAAKTLVESMDRLEAGKYGGIVISPLTRTRIIPDVILIYGNSAQIMRLIQGVMYKEGRRLKAELIGITASCSAGIIRTFNTGEYQLVVPGNGDRVFAMTYDDELLFGVPASKAEELIDGMKKQRVAKYPIPTALPMPPPFPV